MYIGNGIDCRSLRPEVVDRLWVAFVNEQGDWSICRCRHNLDHDDGVEIGSVIVSFGTEGVCRFLAGLHNHQILECGELKE